MNRDRAEAAYRRSDLFERRRTLMQQWADPARASPECPASQLACGPRPAFSNDAAACSGPIQGRVLV